MTQVLYITANPKQEKDSYSLSVAREFLNTYKAANSQDTITELNLYDMDLPFIDADVFSGWGKLQQGNEFHQLNEKEQEKISNINKLTDQFATADKYVLVTPLWNLTVPPKMKAYIDCICIAGKTFRYTENGPEGLLKGKRAIHIQARGGMYSEGPAKELEFGDRYIHGLLSFLGVNPIQSLIIEGMDWMPDKAEDIKATAIMKAKEMAKEF